MTLTMKDAIEKFSTTGDYGLLIEKISQLVESNRGHLLDAIRMAMLQLYWEIGKQIVEFEQGGQQRADYKTELLIRLSRDLKIKYGKGFSASNLYNMRLFYQSRSIFQTSGKLTWGHYCELVGIDNELERSFYEQQAAQEAWSVRELRRQKKSMLFHRLALSTDKHGVLKLAREGKKVDQAEDLLKDPYVLEFLKVAEPYKISEKDLEARLIKHLKLFLLELGKGFAFIGEQYRITLGNRHHFVDLVFYHRILKCFVLIDLKTGKADHSDVGQMNMYLGYFAAEENTDGDNPPIGIVLAEEKNDLVVKYATSNLSSQLFVSKYQLYLPNEAELRAELEYILSIDDENRGK
jgi:predicted nuclease of restriction endonuclease-like (RecB) superfamily